jgi:type VI secretion system secreted protein VgrG
MTLARVGWEMHVAYIDGDPDRPVGIARNINGEMVPTYGQPAKKTVMTVKTQTYPSGGGGGYNELRLDDVAGAMRFDVRAERDLVGMVKHDKSEIVGVNETHVIDARLQHTVERDQVRHVGANDTTTVQGSVQRNVLLDRSVHVGGAETITIDKAQLVTITGDDSEKVGASRITLAQESVTRTTDTHFTRSVGGSYIATAKGAVQNQAGTTFAETVGGAKLTVSTEGGIFQTVSGFLNVDVSGSVLRQARGDMSSSAKTTKINVGTDAALTSAIKIELHSDIIHLEAKEKLTLSAGGLLIEMGPGKTRIVGPLKLTSDNTIRVTGNPDHLTK